MNLNGDLLMYIQYIEGIALMQICLPGYGGFNSKFEKIISIINDPNFNNYKLSLQNFLLLKRKYLKHLNSVD